MRRTRIFIPIALSVAVAGPLPAMAQATAPASNDAPLMADRDDDDGDDHGLWGLLGLLGLAGLLPKRRVEAIRVDARHRK